MENIRIVIIEDEFIVARDIAGQLEKIGYEIAGIFDSGDEAISFIRDNKVDLILVDINIKGALDGIETSEVILKIIDIPLIYVTAYSDSKTLDRAKNTNPHAYIVKPFNFENLHSAIELALYNYSNNYKAEFPDWDLSNIPQTNSHVGTKAFFLKMGRKYEKVSPEDILGFKANGSYTEIVLKDKLFTMSQNLSSILSKMKNYPFVRIHRSYVVNLNHIQSIEEEKVTLDNGVWLKMSKSHRNELLSLIKSI